MPNTHQPYGGGSGAGLSGGEFAGIGLQFALTILIFTAAGIWLDRRLGTSPWLLILCVFVGAGGGFASIYRRATAAQRRDAERREAERRAADAGTRASGTTDGEHRG
jgi:F0F1-type ATP synthase assembly protein I